jgi:thioesterase domain-containing protein
LAVTTISFDIAGVDIWLPLLSGGQTAVASRDAAADGKQLQALMEQHEITFLQATPATWWLLTDCEWSGKANLTAICTGEAMPRELAERLKSRVSRLWNFYGPTETTIWSTAHEVKKNENGPITIGRPLGNTQCYILDTQCQPVPIGLIGELYIAGDGLARGYCNQPELTKEKFVPNPFSPKPGARMYRTGDLARYLADGRIECLGRTDHQVKIRGFRIELGEIEAALKEQPEIEQAVVIAREDKPGDKRLVAYLVVSTSTVLATSELRTRLKQLLPDYMVPADYVMLDSIPLTPNGKIDRKAMPSPEPVRAAEDDGYVAPRDKFEAYLCEAWAAVLGLQRVGIRDDFFELGGHSLLAVKLWQRVQQILPVEQLPLSALLEAPTVERFAVRLRIAKADHSQFLVRMRPGTSNRPPFFCVHGAGGNVLHMRALAMALPADLPFYCFQDKGLDGSEPFESIEENARCYVNEIRKMQPHGPYYLGGTCHGGRLAFQMARTLEELGEPVAALVLIDSFNHAFVRSLSKRERLLLNVRFYNRRMVCHVRKMFSLRLDEWLGYISGLFKALSKRARSSAEEAAQDEAEMIKAVIGTPLGENLTRVIHANVIASRKFVPKPYGGGAIIFRASARKLNPYDDYYMGWGSVVRGGIECFELEGDHMSILEQPAVQLIADKLDAKLKKLSTEKREGFVTCGEVHAVSVNPASANFA